ncbi:UDP-N-acetyl-D-mannosamine dehydrogenase [Mariniblastus sp.]|nr:UDP-N-acetyl-D-mannosamine dehydrogenase [Mariniblastus sp.]
MKFNSNQKICVVGLGYIGLPTAAVLGSRGYKVHGVEINPLAVETINSGKAHIVEPDLDILVRAAVTTGNLKAYTEPAESDIFMICIPTPLTAENKPELSYVRSATKSIVPFLKAGDLIILESTSPPGTTEMIESIVLQESDFKKGDIYFAHAPERVLPGKILREVVENDRIIGGIDDASTEKAAEFYGSFVTGELLKTHCRTAETAKLVENAFRDTNIAFANELSLLSDKMGLDVWELIRLANHHPRVNILNPGPGVGGHCIAVDPWFLVDCAPEQTRLIRTSREVNEAKPHWVVDRVAAQAEKFKNPTIACLGLAYKPDIDDLRESPAVEIVQELQNRKLGQLKIVEPNLESHDSFELSTLDAALEAADIVLILVGHKPFLSLPKAKLAEKIIIDTCGVMNR